MELHINYEQFGKVVSFPLLAIGSGLSLYVYSLASDSKGLNLTNVNLVISHRPCCRLKNKEPMILQGNVLKQGY